MDYICYYFQRNKQLFVAVTGGLNQWAEAAEAAAHTTAHIIREAIHIQAVPDLLLDLHPDLPTDLQDHLHHIIPEPVTTVAAVIPVVADAAMIVVSADA